MTITAVTATLVAIIVVLWLRWRKRNFTTFERLGIPGPKPNIIFGNILEMRQKGPIQAHKDWIQKYGKVLGFYFGFRPVLLVADLEILKLVEVKHFNKFVNRAELFSVLKTSGSVFDNQLINLKNQHWKEVRSIMTPAFTSGKMKLMSDVMNRAVDEMVQEIGNKAKHNEEFDLYNMYQGLTMDVIGQTALGFESGVQKDNDHPLLQSIRLIFSSGKFGWMFTLGRSFLEFQALSSRMFLGILAITRRGRTNPIKEMVGVCQQVIKQRKNNPSKCRNDLLQSLIDAEGSNDAKKIDDQSLTVQEEDSVSQQDKKISTDKSGGSKRSLTDVEITANALLTLLAGYETTSTTLAFTTFYLVNHPEIQEKLRQEVDSIVHQKEGDISYNSLQDMKYMEQVIQEGLRMCPPIYQFVTRESIDDVQLGQWLIPKGMAVMVPVYHLHHDPEHWEEPEKFNPERFSPGNRFGRDPMVWQAFGAGPRNCIGMRFAMMETKLALAKILTKFCLVASEKTEKGSPTLQEGTAAMSPKNRLYLTAVLRSGNGS